MRQSWFDRLDKMVIEVRRFAHPFWDNRQIRRLFRVGMESARNLSIAIGRSPINARSYVVRTENLLTFLEDFRALLCPAAKLKHRSQVIRSAQTLFQQKLERGRHALVEAPTSHATSNFDSALKIQDLLPTCLSQVQVSGDKPLWDEFSGISDLHTQQEATTIKPVRPRVRKNTQVSERFQTAIDFSESSDQPVTETSGKLPEPQ